VIRNTCTLTVVSLVVAAGLYFKVSETLFMISRWLLGVFFILFFFLLMPVDAHVPISAENNNNLNTALYIEKPLKS
jgi:multisubunit Na+/H+ antiporter MnhG subunit